MDLTSSVTTSGYPYYITSSDISTAEYVNKPLTVSKYIPYNIDYLYDTKVYECIPFGKSLSEEITGYYKNNIEYIKIDGQEISISSYNDKLNDNYINILTELNEEYNSLSANMEPSAITRKKEIMVSTLQIVPTQYNNAKLKLIYNEICLSGLTNAEYRTN